MIPCPHDISLGIAYYLRTTSHYDISLAVLLIFDCHVRLKEIQSLTYGTVVFEKPSKRVHLILHFTKRGTNQSVDVRYKIVRELLQRHVSKFINTPDKRLSPFSEDTWQNNIREGIEY